jgi:transposase
MKVRAGRRPDQDWLLPPRMDEWIPPGHLARVVDATVARLDLRAVHARYHQAGAGAPPYDPALLLRVLIYGYLTQRLSSRKMARACEEDLPMLWLARGERPRHSVLAAFRAQCAAEIPGWMAQVVLLATELGLVGWQLGAVDGSKIHADASKHQAMSYQRMQEVVPKLKAEIAALVAAHGAADVADGAAPPPVPPDRLARLETRLAKIQAAMAALEATAAAAAADPPAPVAPDPATATPSPTPTPSPSPSPTPAPGSTPAPTPSPAPGAQYNFTDPESAIMVTKTQGVQQAYNTQILVDATAGLIVGLAVSAHAADTTELGAVLDSTVAGRVPAQVLADAGYGAAANLRDLAARHIDAYVAVGAAGDPPGQDERVRKAHFTYDAATDRYHCPQDQALEYHRTRTASRGGGRYEAVRVYRSAAATCAACPLAAQCLTKGRRTRTVERGPDDPVREAMAAKVRTPAGAALYRQRKGIVEPVFGILKEVLGFRQFSRRGLAAVTSEFTLLALAYNIKVLARGTPRGAPSPAGARAAGILGRLRACGRLTPPLACQHGWLRLAQTGLARRRFPGLLPHAA